MTNELYHHGIKGQKWGIRRYQNEDGSLTPAGKKRYGYIHDAGRMAQEASRIANEKADRQKQMNKGMKERYSEKDAWKTYAQDVFGTTTGKEYGMDRKSFESNVRNQLKDTLEEVDRHDKAVIEAYSAVGERYAKASKLLLETPISTLTKNDLKTAKEFYKLFMSKSSEDLVNDLFIKEFNERY